MKKGELGQYAYLFCFVALVFVFIIFMINNSSSVETVMNVPENNFAPYMIKLIPDQTWARNKNLTSAFDLDDYFQDDEDLISYYVVQVENITIFINETTNEVSFYSDREFSGIRNVTFIASDGEFNTSSNKILLSVTNDSEPPKWISYGMTPSTVYQNTFVNFSAIWTDNVELGSFIFSMNQGSGWINYSQTLLSGILNTSFERIQISAASGSNVLWKFYAFDTTGNMNETPIQFFTVSSLPVSPPSEGSTGSRRTTFQTKTSAAQRYTERQKPRLFSVTPPDIIVRLKQGESTTRLIKIDNLGLDEYNFTIKMSGLEDFVTLNAHQAIIPPGKSAVIAALFSANRRAIVDSYFGKITVVLHTESEEIPVTLIINPYEVDFDLEVEIPSEYKEIKKGEIVQASIIITNKKDLPESKMMLYYSLMDLYGNTLDSNQELINLTDSSLVINRTFSTTKDMFAGDYIFFARITNDKKTVMGLDKFYVGERFNLYSFIKTNIVFILIVLACLVITLLMIYYHKTKEKQRLLNLYVMINDLKYLLEQNKIEEAISQYIKIKSAYNEKVSHSELSDTQELRNEMQKLIKEFNESFNEKGVVDNAKKSDSEPKNTNPETKVDSKTEPVNESEEKTETKPKKSEKMKKKKKSKVKK